MRRRRPVLGFTPFSELSHHKKRDLYISLRQKIANNKHRYNSDKFLSDIVLDEAGRPPLFNQLATLTFLGMDGETIWNATLRSAWQEYWDDIGELASQEAHACEDATKPIGAVPEKFNIREWLIPTYDASGRKTGYTMREDEPQTIYGGLTRGDFMRQYEEELIIKDSGTTAPIYESFRIEPGFEYGIGLYAVMDVEEVNPRAIDAMIDRFRALGEKPWKADAPVPFDRLPKKTLLALASELPPRK